MIIFVSDQILKMVFKKNLLTEGSGGILSVRKSMNEVVCFVVRCGAR